MAKYRIRKVEYGNGQTEYRIQEFGGEFGWFLFIPFWNDIFYTESKDIAEGQLEKHRSKKTTILKN